MQILEAAKTVCQSKGMNGARMKEIADKAGINKAMLHYHYRSKQLLFEAVFKHVFSLLAPQLNAVLNDDQYRATLSVNQLIYTVGLTDASLTLKASQPYLKLSF